MAAPGKYNLTIYQGDDFVLHFRLKDNEGAYYNLTGQVGKAQIREHADSDVVAELTVTLGSLAGEVVLTLTGEQTADLPLKPLVYDVELAQSGGTGRRTYLAGNVKVLAQVTR